MGRWEGEVEGSVFESLPMKLPMTVSTDFALGEGGEHNFFETFYKIRFQNTFFPISVI